MTKRHHFPLAPRFGHHAEHNGEDTPHAVQKKKTGFIPARAPAHGDHMLLLYGWLALSPAPQ